jgi:hypothetical protein
MYLSDPKNVKKALKLLEISLDELESVVGRFKPDHHNWPNQLKGELVIVKNKARIRHHFTKKKLFESDFDPNNL